MVGLKAGDFMEIPISTSDIGVSSKSGISSMAVWYWLSTSSG